MRCATGSSRSGTVSRRASFRLRCMPDIAWAARCSTASRRRCGERPRCCSAGRRSMSREAQVQALVLDFGGVISRTLFETHALTEAALGLARNTLTWRGPFAPETDPLWQSMQREEISERDYW